MHTHARYTREGFTCKPNPAIATMQIKQCGNSFLDYKIIKTLLEDGHSVMFGNIKKGMELKAENIELIDTIALDIDSKENPITMPEMIEVVYKTIGIRPIIAYPTFSDTDFTRFRLIYHMDETVDNEVFGLLYQAFQWKLGKYIDHSTKNANRIWHGTDKQVYLLDNHIPLCFLTMSELIRKFIENRERAKKKEELKRIETLKGKVTSVNFRPGRYVLKEYRKDVMEYIIQSIDLKRFIEDNFGGSYTRHGNDFIGSCPFHGGKNKTSLRISENFYHCFSSCGSGNVITLAKKIYGTDNFSEVALRLSQEYNLLLPDHCLGGKDNE